MDKKIVHRYVKKIEKKIEPAKIASAFQGAEMLRKLPLKLQEKILAKVSSKDPAMGFIVEPYSTFLAYEAEPAILKKYLPDQYEAAPISMFADTPKRPCAILGCFNVHTNVFWGSRYELYIIAKNKRTGLTSWIICGYESNTINYEPGSGFAAPTTEISVHTTTYAGEVITDFKSRNTSNRASLTIDLNGAAMRELDKKLWIEGNLSVDYAGDLGNSKTDPFGLVFDPAEMDKALYIEPENAAVHEMSFSFLDASMKPFEVCCFPFAQHYVTTQMPIGHELKDEQDLIDKVTELSHD